MKNLLLMLVLLASFSFAYSQTEVCEAQCQAWKFVWQDDYHFDYLVTMCAKDPGDVSIDMVGFWADMVTKSVGLQTYMEVYLCADVATTYIQPQIDECELICAQNALSYAPNLYLDSYSVYYSESNRYVRVGVHNNGRAYLPSSYAEVYAGESDNASIPTNMRLLKNTTVPGLRPHDVRYLPEGFETDEYYFTVPYTPAPDKYNVVRVVLHADPQYQEMGTRDNTYDLVINDLPRPANLWIEDARFSRHEQDTDRFHIYADVTNDGELPADAEVRYYFGPSRLGDLAASDQIRVEAGGLSHSDAFVTFTPEKSPYITVQLFSEGEVIMERLLYPQPAFFYIYGKVEDEDGRPIPDAQVKLGTFGGIMQSSGEQGSETTTDAGGNYELPIYLAEERNATISAQKGGYFPNSTSVVLEYNQTGSTWLEDRRVRADITLAQYPLEIHSNYPSGGRYIVETDKGRFTGTYSQGSPIPVRGSNGTVFISSPLCSFMAGEFSTDYFEGFHSTYNDVLCLTPDSNDDYSILQEEELLWEKEYSGEEPRAAYFSRKGNRAYVVTAESSTNFCNLYAYGIPNGEQLFRFQSGTPCAQRLMVSPSHDGLYVYFGVPAVGNPRRGGTPAKGYILGPDGSVSYSWDFNEDTESLAHSSAATMAELVQDSIRFYARGNITLRNCNLVLDAPCNQGGERPEIETLGLTKNRVVGTCGSVSCIFTPAYNDTILLDRHYTNPMGSGNYANPDVFVADYRNGSYFRGGQILWSTEKDLKRVSMSPGGAYVVLAYDPYKIEVFSAEGQSLVSSSDHATGMEATESGIFYATHQGSRIEVYRLSTMVQSSSSTGSTGGNLFTFFVDLWEMFVGLFNWMLQPFFPSG